jgi:hypothetical protein
MSQGDLQVLDAMQSGTQDEVDLTKVQFELSAIEALQASREQDRACAGKLAEASAALAVAQRELSENQERVLQLRRDLDFARGREAKLAQRLETERRVAQDTLAASLAAAREERDAHVRQLKGEIDALRVQVVEEERRAAQAEAGRASCQQRLVELQERFAERESRLLVTISSLEGDLAGARHELAACKAEVACATASRIASEQQLSAARAGNGGRRDEAKKAKEEKEEKPVRRDVLDGTRERFAPLDRAVEEAEVEDEDEDEGHKGNEARRGVVSNKNESKGEGNDEDEGEREDEEEADEDEENEDDADDGDDLESFFSHEDQDESVDDADVNVLRRKVRATRAQKKAAVSELRRAVAEREGRVAALEAQLEGLRAANKQAAFDLVEASERLARAETERDELARVCDARESDAAAAEGAEDEAAVALPRSRPARLRRSNSRLSLDSQLSRHFGCSERAALESELARLRAQLLQQEARTRELEAANRDVLTRLHDAHQQRCVVEMTFSDLQRKLREGKMASLDDLEHARAESARLRQELARRDEQVLRLGEALSEFWVAR